MGLIRVLKVNESQILIHIKNNFCIIYERKNQISEKLKKELKDINNIDKNNKLNIIIKEKRSLNLAINHTEILKLGNSKPKSNSDNDLNNNKNDYLNQHPNSLENNNFNNIQIYGNIGKNENPNTNNIIPKNIPFNSNPNDYGFPEVNLDPLSSKENIFIIKDNKPEII